MATPTTYPHVSKGPTLVTWNSLALGYAEDRISIEERPFWEDIRNDAFGGGAGAPSDGHYLGSIAIVSCNLNRFSDANVKALADLDAANVLTVGTMPDVGTFMRQDAMYSSLVLTNASETLTYPIAFLRQGRRFNTGTRHQIFSLTFECHIDDPCTQILFAYSAASDPCESS